MRLLPFEGCELTSPPRLRFCQQVLFSGGWQRGRKGRVDGGMSGIGGVDGRVALRWGREACGVDKLDYVMVRLLSSCLSVYLSTAVGNLRTFVVFLCFWVERDDGSSLLFLAIFMYFDLMLFERQIDGNELEQ